MIKGSFNSFDADQKQATTIKMCILGFYGNRTHHFRSIMTESIDLGEWCMYEEYKNVLYWFVYVCEDVRLGFIRLSKQLAAATDRCNPE